MSAIRMNAWVFEKAGDLVGASIALLRSAEMVDVEARCPWGETVREYIMGKAWAVYWGGILFTAYASGEFPTSLMSIARRAFTEGPGSMEALVHILAARQSEHGGWDLPNPVYHHNVVAF